MDDYIYNVEKHRISRKDKEFADADRLSQITLDLYNYLVTHVENHHTLKGSYTHKYIKNGVEQETMIYTRANLDGIVRTTPLFRTSEQEKYGGYVVNTKICEQTVTQVQDAFRFYLKAKKEYNKNKSGFTGKPKPPRISKRGRHIVRVPCRAISTVAKKGYAHISRTDIYIKLIKATPETIAHIELIPRRNYYDVRVVYKVPAPKEIEIPSTVRACGIDFGMDNIMTVGSNCKEFEPVIYDSTYIIQENESYHSKRGELREKLPNNRTRHGRWKAKGNKEIIYTSNQIMALECNHEDKIESEMHRITNDLIRRMKLSDINTLVVGWNEGIKQRGNMGRNNNRKFQSISYYRLRQILQYKCAKVGIRYVETEESYTSKSSFFDFEKMEKKDIYLGSRVKRGLFITSKGKEVNADINGAYNIIRKVFGYDIFKIHACQTNSTATLARYYYKSPKRVVVSRH